MPPCGGVQQVVSVRVSALLDQWLDQRSEPVVEKNKAVCADEPADEYVIGCNEAGMCLGGEVRGADAAVWRRDELGTIPSGYIRVPPVLAVEVAGKGEGEVELVAKAGWYFRHGVKTVWIVLPEQRDVLVLRGCSASGEAERFRCQLGHRLPENPELPGLRPMVDAFFRRL